MQLGKIIFLRHGQTEYTEKYHDLTAEGIASAKAIAKKVASLIADQYYPNILLLSSPTPRAKATAKPIAEALSTRIKIDEKLSAAKIEDRMKAKALYLHIFNTQPIKKVSKDYVQPTNLIIDTKTIQR